MIYRVYADENLIFSNDLEELALIDPIISVEMGMAGSFNFTMLPSHYFYNRITKLKTIISVTADDHTIFVGRALNTIVGWNTEIKYECEGILAFLNDSIIRPFDYEGTAHDLFISLINQHNEQSEFQFNIGTIYFNSVSLTLVQTEYKNTLENIRSLVNQVGGFLTIDFATNTINWIGLITESNSQAIKLGENLLDLSEELNGEDLCTRVIPLGAKDEDGRRLTIQGLVANDYIEDSQMVAKYGIITKVITYDDVTSAQTLLAKAESYLADAVLDNITLEISAIDLSVVDEAEAIDIGKFINVEAQNLKTTLLVSSRTYNLTRPQNDTLTLSKTSKNLTQYLSNENSVIRETIVKNGDAIVLEEKRAKESELSIIATADNLSIKVGDLEQCVTIDNDGVRVGRTGNEYSTLTGQVGNTVGFFIQNEQRGTIATFEANGMTTGDWHIQRSSNLLNFFRGN